MVGRRSLILLSVAVASLPAAICFSLGGARVLDAMGDPSGAKLFDRLALLGGLAWAMSILGLLLALAAWCLTRGD